MDLYKRWIKQILICIRGARMGKQNGEIAVDSKKIEKSVQNLKEIDTRLDICRKQRLLLRESTGVAAEQMERMYDQVLEVANAMKELVEQTTVLVEDGKNKFQEADARLARMYQG